MSLNISLDYDGTITGEPSGFLRFAQDMKDRGHKIYIVTMRYPSELKDIPSIWKQTVEDIIPTSREAKKPFMEKMGIPIHIWVDDNPDAVYKSAAQIWGNASPEGNVIIIDHQA